MIIAELTRDYSVQWRRKNKVSLKELAEYLGCHFTLISKWELSTQNMGHKYLIKYIEFINGVEDGTIKIENKRGKK